MAILADPLRVPGELLAVGPEEQKIGQRVRLGIQRANIPGAILGLALMRRYTTIFDLDNNRIGFYDSGYRTVRLMKELKFQLSLYNLMFVVMFGLIIAHFIVMGIKAIHLGGEGFNFFEMNYFE